MSLILNIETATTNCSVSLSRDGKVIALKEDYSAHFSHAERLHQYIDVVLTTAKVSIEHLDAIAISKGPGSYTGLRIGVSSAKGLCFASNKPLISVPTLESLAHQMQINDGFIVPMLDARRMEVYSAIFDESHIQVRDTEAQIIDENSFKPYLDKKKVYFIGSGVDKCKTIIVHDNAVFVEDKLPSANEMGALSYVKHKISDTEDVAYFEPYYLKDFVTTKPKN